MNWWWDLTDHWDFELLAVRSPFIEVLTTNGTISIQSRVTGVTAPRRRSMDNRRDRPSDKQLHFIARQRESACRYRDAISSKQENFTHICYQQNRQKSDIPWAYLCFLFLHSLVLRDCSAELMFFSVLFLNLPLGQQDVGSRGAVWRICFVEHVWPPCSWDSTCAECRPAFPRVWLAWDQRSEWGGEGGRGAFVSFTPRSGDLNLRGLRSPGSLWPPWSHV